MIRLKGSTDIGAPHSHRPTDLESRKTQNIGGGGYVIRGGKTLRDRFFCGSRTSAWHSFRSEDGDEDGGPKVV